MIIQCSDCKTRFRLDPDRVPRRLIRVRCSRCHYVFSVDGRMVDEAPVEAAAPDSSGPATPAPPSGPFSPASDGFETSDRGPSSGGIGLEVEHSRVEGLETGYAASTPAAPSQENESSAATATLDQEEQKSAPDEVEIEPAETARPTTEADTDPRAKKARRLARALVSDILVYNRELRDRSLAEGNLVQALGPEIKKSWELYKEKVDPEFAKESDFFRQALNEILADGQKIF